MLNFNLNKIIFYKMKKSTNPIKNITIKRGPSGKKTRIETFNDEFNNVYYNILNPKSPNDNSEDIETLLKEIEFYKVQFLAEKNINQSLSDEISHLSEIQKLSKSNNNNNNNNNIEDKKILQDLALLEKKNKFLEESVFKLKSTLDRANLLFPNFLKKLESSNNNNICLPEKDESNNNKNEELIKLEEENKMLKITMNNMDEIIKSLKNENELLNKKLKIKEKNEKFDETILTNKVDDCNNRLIEDNKKLKSYINKIDELQKNNENYIYQINYLQEIIDKKNEKIENFQKIGDLNGEVD